MKVSIPNVSVAVAKAFGQRRVNRVEDNAEMNHWHHRQNKSNPDEHGKQDEQAEQEHPELPEE